MPVMERAVGKRQVAGFQALCQKLRPDLLRFAYWLCHESCVGRGRRPGEHALTIVRRELARTFERKRLKTVDVDDLIAEEAPALAVGDQDDLEEMRAAIFTLPLEYREPLVMQALLGYSTAEIASELKLSVPAVLTRLFRARHQLRNLCGEDTSQDPPT
jgi:RNA polymerase sigma-70 factor, ECF subfamily